MSELPVLTLCCPACRGKQVLAAPLHYDCADCKRSYPVIYGIPDLRLTGDRYLDLAAERSKAQRLAVEAGRRSFTELLDFYYRITSDVTPTLAARYSHAARTAAQRATPLLNELAGTLAPGARVLDVGCGTGGALIAGAARGLNMVGVDVALRWLVICRKRLLELSLDVPLYCADVAQLPFADGSFAAALALDVLDHVEVPSVALSAIRTALANHGQCVLTAANRCSPGPELSTGIWGIGLLPKNLRRKVVARRLGVDALRFAELYSWRELAALASRFQLVHNEVRARRVLAGDPTRGAFERALLRAYVVMSESRIGQILLREISPSFEMWLIVKNSQEIV